MLRLHAARSMKVETVNQLLMIPMPVAISNILIFTASLHKLYNSTSCRVCSHTLECALELRSSALLELERHSRDQTRWTEWIDCSCRNKSWLPCMYAILSWSCIVFQEQFALWQCTLLGCVSSRALPALPALSDAVC